MVFLLALLLAQAAPQKSPEKAAVSGHVLNAATGEPLKKAQLSLHKAEPPFDNQSYAAETDAGGAFVIKDIPPGKYRLMAERTGFVLSQYGSRGPGRPGATIALDAGQELKDLEVRLTPQGVITGRVLDEDGEPIAWAQVQLHRYQYIRGRRQLMPANGSSTNDLGEYRIFGLAPGKYYLSATYRRMAMGMMGGGSGASGGAAAEEGYVPVYYPNTTDAAAAAPVQVAAGAVLRGIDFTLSKVRTVRVSGRILNPMTSRPGQRTMVSLAPREGAGMMNRQMVSVNDPQGRFVLHNVAPGAYILSADWFEDNKRYSARQPIDIGNSNIENVTLTISPGNDLNGQVKVEDGKLADAGDLHIFLQPQGDAVVMYGASGGTVKEDGSFTLQNVAPDTYTVNVSGLRENFYVKSVKLGDEDATETGVNTARAAGAPLQVVLSPNGGQIEGVALDDKQQPASGSTVVLVPNSRRDQAQLYKSASTDQYGRFTLKGIPPGDYKLFAWEDVEAGAYQDPEFLKPYENLGESYAIHENSRESAQLKLIPAEGKRGTAEERR